MSHDTLADALNKMMNAVRAGQVTVTISHSSRLLFSVLALAKLKGYITDYKNENNILTITLGKLNACKSIKPRYLVHSEELDEFVARYLPARELGMLVVSTPEGIMTHQTAQQKKIGGSLLAYFY
ncbi:MAG TPA: 30S ribosomal protein S8 [Candidatus Nanoarchaeia archaeon]|nr:30S ribosomal protein S8 [Candidatus Nanoarchaeia archaeon]